MCKHVHINLVSCCLCTE